MTRKCDVSQNFIYGQYNRSYVFKTVGITPTVTQIHISYKPVKFLTLKITLTARENLKCNHANELI